MNIVCVQFDITWEDPPSNYAKVSDLLDAAEVHRGDLVLLPELFAVGFTMNTTGVAEEPEGPTFGFLAELAGRWGVYVLGGLATSSGGVVRNEAVLLAPDGRELARYGKMHLFSPAQEADHYAPGQQIAVAQVRGLDVAPAICYDLRFPEFFRTATRQGAELFAVIANWPASRQEHWLALLRARAIENQAYVAGVNRCGRDPNVTYAGGSIIIGPRGEILAQAQEHEGIIRAAAEDEALRVWRRDFPVLKDMREDLL
ncbi:MAG: carbon-nitrogen family hydrolase [Phycisphaerae bacterium]|jgi:predicted amidohydrolase|nr:carbon-nitrogen family hydrolase [Phycisphaerae bacterium]